MRLHADACRKNVRERLYNSRCKIANPREGIAYPSDDDKESKMIKPLEEHSPEDRAFVEYVQKRLRRGARPRVGLGRHSPPLKTNLRSCSWTITTRSDAL